MEETAHSEKILLTWKAPARAYKARNREYYTTIGAIVFLLAVILFFLKEWMLIGVMVGMVFVAYALAAVPPEEVEHTLSTNGLLVGGKQYSWDDVARFWFEDKWKQPMVVFEMRKGFPARLILLLGATTKETMRGVVEKHAKFEQPEPRWVDLAASWLTKKFPLDTD